MSKAPERFYISSIEDRFGTNHVPSKLTVIVGPNNAGKSRLLRAIRDEILGRIESVADKDWGVCLHFPEKPEDFFEHYHVADHLKRNANGGYSLIDYCSCGLVPTQHGYNKADTGHYSISFDWKSNVNTWYGWEEDDLSCAEFKDKTVEFRRHFGAMFVNYCGTEDRLLFAAGEQYHGLNDDGSSALSEMFNNPSVKHNLSKIIHDVFGCGIDLDLASRSGYVTPKVLREGTEEPSDNNEKEESLAEATLSLALKPNLSDEGDGIKGFFAVAMMVLANNKPVILIDEPESYLHPPQAYKLGSFIGDQARLKSETQILVATHSSYILQGVLASGIDANEASIIRLERAGSGCMLNVASPDSFQEVLKNPVLRSGKFFDGIFSQTTVLVESETDELVYRSLAKKCEFGNDVLFLNVHGKHQFAAAVAFFRCIGANCRLIADLDLLNSAEIVKKLLAELRSPEEDIEHSINCVRKIESKLRSGGDGDGENAQKAYKKKFKQFDTEVFSQVKSELDFLRNTFSSLGCLVLESGELETILGFDVPYTSNKNEWLNNALAWIEGSPKDKVKSLPIAQQLKSLVQK